MRLQPQRLLKAALFLLCLVPAGIMVRDALTGNLDAEPIKDLTHRTGLWAIRLLAATLAVTPLRRLTGVNWFGSVRRMLGLFAFCYAACHFLVYLVLDQFFDWRTIVEDIGKRPYITVGFTALALLIPLAITSNARMTKRLGRRWKQLHALVYVIALLGIVHFTWSQKADLQRPTVYGLIIAGLLLLRLVPKGALEALRGRSASPGRLKVVGEESVERA
jgi:sulfoxide reductase heme-binding subunit YedZ